MGLWRPLGIVCLAAALGGCLRPGPADEEEGEEEGGEDGGGDGGEGAGGAPESLGPVDVDGDGFLADGDCNDWAADANPLAQEVCDGIDNDCDGQVDEDFDEDKDRFSPCQGDCDDYDGSANPTQREQCDQFDNDCDGLVDEGFDFDLDGWSICMADCNDAYPEVYPYAPEVCNLVDDDCDRIVDEGFDQDFDGWAVCEGDCDDRLATVNPGAGNCPPDSLLGEDGSLATAIEGEIPLEEAEAQVAGEDVGARAGTALRAAGDVDGDGWGDLWIGAPGGGPKGGGLACWFRGPLPPTVLELADAAACLGGEVGGDGLGSALASGDLDGDRLPELLAGAPGASGGAGQVRIVPGASAGVDPLAAATTLVGEARGDRAGAAVAWAGDLDGDGHADLLVGAPAASTPAGRSGAAYGVAGPIEAGTRDLGAGGAVLQGVADGDEAGAAVARGFDLDGDGWPDVVVGAPGSDEGGQDSGAVYVVRGPLEPGRRSLAEAHAVWVGEHEGDGAGRALAVADVDGDLHPDLLVGAPGSDDRAPDAGKVHVVFGPIAAGRWDLALAGASLVGESEGEAAGSAVAGAGDLDLDGWPDVVVGAPGPAAEPRGTGAAYVLFGPLPSSPTGLAEAGAILYGEAEGDQAGAAVGAGGDLDGDGWLDVLVGAPGADHFAEDGGQGYVVDGG